MVGGYFEFGHGFNRILTADHATQNLFIGMRGALFADGAVFEDDFWNSGIEMFGFHERAITAETCYKIGACFGHGKAEFFNDRRELVVVFTEEEDRWHG